MQAIFVVVGALLLIVLYLKFGRGPRELSADEQKIAHKLKDQILNDVKNNKIVMYSKTLCPYCVMAKRLFSSLNQNVKVVEIDQSENKNIFQNALFQITKQWTVPNIWINGKFIGGNSHVQELHSAGKLLPLL
ncbi:glutaredoxin, mitochondrial [Acrasis kona]|uniref:Glutaredoxin-2, mitochondrial n=1 Tax=Acrasis kona TaxID=1008807 RepID=A0AAW2ZBK7_9EUKA